MIILLHLQETTFIPDQSFPIHIFFTSEIPIHWHDHLEWILVQKGKARIQIDDTFVELESGELAIIGPKQLHSAKSLEEETKLVAVVFNEAIIRSHSLDYAESSFFQPYLTGALKLPGFLMKHQDIEKIEQSISCIINEYSTKAQGFELMIKSEIFKVFGFIFREYYQYDQDAEQGRQKNYNLSYLLDHLRMHFDKDISLAQAAQQVNVSPNHLCKIFKKVTGKTLTTYVHHLRINEGERLLVETDDTVEHIAEKVGFSSVTYFGRVFKKIKGMTPSKRRLQFHSH